MLHDRSAQITAYLAAQPLKRAELAKRFGFSQSLRALTSTRSLAMILMHGLKALANPTRLRVLEAVGLVESRKVGRWVVYTRDGERIRQLKRTIIDQLLPGE